VLLMIITANPLAAYDTRNLPRKVTDIDADTMLALRNPTPDPKTGRLVSVQMYDRLEAIAILERFCPAPNATVNPGVAAPDNAMVARALAKARKIVERERIAS